MDNELKEMLGAILEKISKQDTMFIVLESGLQGIKSGQQRLEIDIQGLKINVQKLEQKVNETNLKLENIIEPKIQLIYENQVEIIEHDKQLINLKNNLDSINTDVLALKEGIKQLQIVK